MYYYADAKHGVLELKSVPPRGKDGIQFIPRSSGVDGIDCDVIVLEDTPEEALKQLCWEVEILLEGMVYYRDIEIDEDKKEELWRQASEFVFYYDLYVGNKGKVSTTDDFGDETWFSCKSPDLESFVEYYIENAEEEPESNFEILENTWLPGGVPTEDKQVYYYHGGLGVGILSSVGIPRATEGRVYVLEDGDYDVLYDYDLVASVVRSTPEEVLEDLRQTMVDQIPYERGLVVVDDNGEAYFIGYEAAIKYLEDFEVSVEMLDALANFNPETHYMTCAKHESNTYIELCLRNQDGF